MNTLSSCAEARQILVVIPDLTTGGGERVTRQLIECLAHQGFHIRLLSDVPESLRRQLPLAGYRRMDWSQRLQRFSIIAQELFQCDRNTPVLAVLTGPIIAVGWLNIFLGRKVIAHEHSDIEQLYLKSSKFKRMMRLLALRMALRSLSRIAVVSDYLHERLPQILRCANDKVAVVRNPVQPFLEKISCEITAKPGPKLTAYIIGRNAPEKRHCESIELLAALDRVETIVLVARDVQSLHQQLSPQAQAKLRMISCLTELPRFNCKTSFLFSYSAVESYSLVIAEWLASGLTVLTVDNEPMRRLWQAWQGCHFVPAHSTHADVEAALSRAYKDHSTDERELFKPISIQLCANDLKKLLTHD